MASKTVLEENKQTVRRLPEEVVSKGDLDVIDEIFTEDVIDHNPLGETRSREAIKESTEYLHAAFADASATVEEAVAEDDTVVLRVTVRGRHDGEFMGIEPTGQEFEIQNVLFCRMRDGQIAERRVHPDLFGLMQQLGVVEQPGE